MCVQVMTDEPIHLTAKTPLAFSSVSTLLQKASVKRTSRMLTAIAAFRSGPLRDTLQRDGLKRVEAYACGAGWIRRCRLPVNKLLRVGDDSLVCLKPYRALGCRGACG